MNVFKIIICVGILAFASNAGAEDKPFIYDDEGRRDPFWKLVNSGGAIVNYGSDLMITDMVLEGIIADVGGQNMAIINGSVVRPEDTIGLFVIESISQDKVVLVKGGENFILRLTKEE